MYKASQIIRLKRSKKYEYFNTNIDTHNFKTSYFIALPTYILYYAIYFQTAAITMCISCFELG